MIRPDRREGASVMLTEGGRRINGISRLHGSADRETKKTQRERAKQSTLFSHTVKQQ